MQKNAYAGGLVALAIGLLDAFLKNYALVHFPSEQAAYLQPVLSFAVHKNPGILFDIPLPLIVIVPATILALIILVNVARYARLEHPWLFLGAAGAIVGATNNLIDRLVHGFTTDYLIFFKLSAINLSDVLIFLGVVMIAWYSQRNSPVQQKS